MKLMSKNIEWIANGSQSLITALYLGWAFLYVCNESEIISKFASDPAPLLLVVAVVGIILGVVIYSLLGNAVLVALRGLGVIKESDGFDEIGKLGNWIQFNCLIGLTASCLILSPFAAIGLFDSPYLAGVFIFVGVIVLFLLIMYVFYKRWLSR